MKRSILLLFIILVTNNAMDEKKIDLFNIQVRLPSHQCLNIVCSYDITLKQLKEFIHKNHDTEDMPLPVDGQVFHPIKLDPRFNNVIRPSNEQITDDTIRVATIVLAHHTRIFKLAIHTANTE